MSALGQKQTCAVQNVMFALCQKQTSRRFRKRHPSCRELSPDCAFVGGWRA